ncbi:hypothetical protein, partial [Pseudomonas granadensis]|uniref:hypothetical protein n=1 Tax=Pseudomonas granadensis TaxID=1421430 RepID=UPI0019D1B0AA
MAAVRKNELHHTKNCSVTSGRFFNDDGQSGSIHRRNFLAGKTKPQLLSQLGFRNLILTMTYS